MLLWKKANNKFAEIRRRAWENWGRYTLYLGKFRFIWFYCVYWIPFLDHINSEYLLQCIRSYNIPFIRCRTLESKMDISPTVTEALIISHSSYTRTQPPTTPTTWDAPQIRPSPHHPWVPETTTNTIRIINSKATVQSYSWSTFWPPKRIQISCLWLWSHQTRGIGLMAGKWGMMTR